MVVQADVSQTTVLALDVPAVWSSSAWFGLTDIRRI